MSKRAIESVNIHELSVPGFGYELIREDLLNEILGNDASNILYWAGKRLARKYPLFSLDELIEFFMNAGWGRLELLGEEKDELEFSLTGDLIEYRLKTKTSSTFQLEAGFLAEQIQQMKKAYAECFEHPRKRDYTIIFTIKWDKIPYNL